MLIQQCILTYVDSKEAHLCTVWHVHNCILYEQFVSLVHCLKETFLLKQFGTTWKGTIFFQNHSTLMYSTYTCAHCAVHFLRC